MDIWIMVTQTLLAIGIIVGVHEAGHLLAAKFFGMRVDRYSIGFPPHIFQRKWGETVYAIGLIPLGGYVKIAGMIDESMDTKHLQETPEPWEFRSKPAWQRLIVMLGGIFVNIVMGICIFFFLTYLHGETYLSKAELDKHGIVAHALGKKIGLETGDKIVEVNKHSYDRFSDLRSPEVFLDSEASYTVLREGTSMHIPIPSDFLEEFATKEAADSFISPRIPFQIGAIKENYPAHVAGLRAEDNILSIGGQEIRYFDELRDVLRAHAGKDVVLNVMREGRVATLSARLSHGDTLGIAIVSLLQSSHQQYSLGESAVKGFNNAFTTIGTHARGLMKIIRGEVSASKSLSGPIGIAQMFGSSWQGYRFWYLVGLLSLVIAFLNLLPIPALDGGHATMCVYEMVTRRKPSEKFSRYAQMTSMVLLLALMAFVIFNDILKLT